MTDQTLPDSLPEVFTLRTLFTHYLDFNAIPRRTFFQYLRDFTTDDMEREKMEEFLSKDGAVSRFIPAPGYNIKYSALG